MHGKLGHILISFFIFLDPFKAISALLFIAILSSSLSCVPQTHTLCAFYKNKNHHPRQQAQQARKELPPADALSQLTNKELKALAVKCAVSTAGCLEKVRNSLNSF